MVHVPSDVRGGGNIDFGVISLSQRLNATAKCHVTLSMG